MKRISKLSAVVLCLALLTGCAGTGADTRSYIPTNLTDRTPIIIDCDMGIVDFYALGYVGTCDKLDLRAVTTTYGATTLENATANALGAVSLYGYDCPVAVGSVCSLSGSISIQKKEQGENGLGNTVLPPPSATADAAPAWDLIYQIAQEEKGSLQIVAMGPLTNIAKAIQQYPDILPLIAGITVTGGDYRDEVTANGEFNAACDPQAMQTVLQSGIPLTLLGQSITDLYRIGQVTTKGRGTSVDEWLMHQGRFTDTFQAVRRYADQKAEETGEDTMVFPEIMAILTVIDDSLLPYQYADAVTCTPVDIRVTFSPKGETSHIRIADFRAFDGKYWQRYQTYFDFMPQFYAEGGEQP